MVNDKYGTDAVRFGLLVAAAPGNDIALSEEVIARGRNFANKIWNASRLLFSKEKGAGARTSLADRWIGSRLNAAIERANAAFETHRYHEAADAVWTFFWDEFCDWYLELKKSDDDWGFAYEVHERALLLLHPLMPFITEELWHRRGHETSIALERYPKFDASLKDDDAEREIWDLYQLIKVIREFRVEHNIDKKRLLRVTVQAEGKWYKVAANNRGDIMRLTNLETLEVNEGLPEGFQNSSYHFTYHDVDVQLTEEHKGRLRKDYLQLLKVIANQKRQLDDDTFTSKAPAKVIDSMRGKLAEYDAELAKLEAQLGKKFTAPKADYYELFKVHASQKKQLDNRKFVTETPVGEVETLRASMATNEEKLKSIEAAILS